MIKVGSIVKCVDGNFDGMQVDKIPNRPVGGNYYMVRGIFDKNGQQGLYLEELVNPPIQTKSGAGEPSFRIERFVPEEDIDISELLEVLECEEA
jgi:hypothetical protein